METAAGTGRKLNALVGKHIGVLRRRGNRRCGTGPIISAIIATAVNNEIMRLTEATSFREGGARQPRHVAQRGCSMTGWELGAWLK